MTFASWWRAVPSRNTFSQLGDKRNTSCNMHIQISYLYGGEYHKTYRFTSPSLTGGNYQCCFLFKYSRLKLGMKSQPGDIMVHWPNSLGRCSTSWHITTTVWCKPWTMHLWQFDSVLLITYPNWSPSHVDPHHPMLLLWCWSPSHVDPNHPMLVLMLVTVLCWFHEPMLLPYYDVEHHPMWIPITPC